MRIGVVGCTGRMGKTVIREALRLPAYSVVGGTLPPKDIQIGKDLGVLAGEDPIGAVAGGTLEDLCKKTDALIDFSMPEVTLESLKIASEYPLVYVIGTTGFNESQSREIHAYAKKIPIIWSANMSVGVNLLLGLTQQVAHILDDHFDIEIIEAHHRHKVDSPSGTALALGRAAAKGREVALEEMAVKSRDGLIGARHKGSIGFATVRGGDIVGDHTVLFAAEGERIELTHKASDRSIFAKGALRAALWGKDKLKKPGLYSMQDVLF